mgnify:CR=1 FL=1
MNRGMGFVTTPLVIFTDANTFINPQAVREIVKCFNHPQVGCVAGEKRVDMYSTEGAVSGGEGLYWKYESWLKKMDYQLYSAIGAAGELFAIRTPLYEEMPEDTLLDDFMLSLRIAMKQYTIAYCDTAYALESGSADMKEEEKRNKNKQNHVKENGQRKMRRRRTLEKNEKKMKTDESTTNKNRKGENYNSTNSRQPTE